MLQYIIDNYLTSSCKNTKKKERVRTLSKNLYELWETKYFDVDDDSNQLSSGLLAQRMYEQLQPSLLPGEAPAKQRIVVFNPTKGLWENDFRALRHIADVLKGGVSDSTFNSMLGNIESAAHSANIELKPYNGSQYILFLNGVLDIQSKELYALDADFVKDLQFTNRHRLQIEYDENAKDVIIPNGKTFGGDWSIHQFLRAYANNDDDAYDMLMFGLALGLFPGHNTGVHFDIQGDSGWGKSTLANIFRSLFDDRIIQIPFSALNGRFPFNNYSPDTSAIWLSENNVGSDPLNDMYGTIHYDSLADVKARFEVKGQGDTMLENPPQVYIDGTQLVRAENMQTGPARRTLAYVLPKLTQDLREQLYGLNIEEYLAREDVLQFIVNECINAFRKIVPKNRQNNFKMNLALSSDMDILPDIAKEWRRGIVESTSNIENWVQDYVYPYIDSTSWIHERFLYMLYLEWHAENNPQDKFNHLAIASEKFHKELLASYQSHNYHVAYLPKTASGRNARKQISDINKMQWNLQLFMNEHSIPEALTNPNTSEYKGLWNKQITGWYHLEKDE